MKRALLFAGAGLVVTLVVLAIIYQRNLERVAFAASLFTGAEEYEYFNRLDDRQLQSAFSGETWTCRAAKRASSGAWITSVAWARRRPVGRGWSS